MKKFNITIHEHHAVFHKKVITEPHNWSTQEEYYLMMVFEKYPYDWNAIAHCLNLKYETNIVDEQVKNKFYSMRSSAKHEEMMKNFRIPRTRRGCCGWNSWPGRRSQTEDRNGDLRVDGAYDSWFEKGMLIDNDTLVVNVNGFTLPTPKKYPKPENNLVDIPITKDGRNKPAEGP